MLKLGCHLSVSAGYAAMARTAVSVGANVFQFFTRNPRGGSAKPIDPADIGEFLRISRDEGLSDCLAHAPYTLNACAAKPELRVFARETMADDLKRLECIPGSLYNFHPGSHVGQGVETGIELIADILNNVLTQSQSVTVLLETMAGKGSEVGGSFEELRAIIDRVELKDKLGVCLDTCHVYDAGYDIRGDLDGVLREFDRVIGLDRLRAVHINDSKNPFGSHKDRHEVIGGGSLGTEFFASLLHHPLICDRPFYLETPNELEGYKREIALLRSL